MDITYTLMLPALQFLAKTLGSYGWAILGLTLAVRLAVWPFVNASTRNMQKMAQLQPKIKAMQERYKEQPEVFQKKMAEFYSRNKINPVGGCLPMLLQLPILFALFSTFTGPPFQDKPVPVKVKIIAPDNANKTAVTLNPTSSSGVSYVSREGKLCKFVVHPGDSTMVLGKNAEGQPTPDGFNTVDFSISTQEGTMPQGFEPTWKIQIDPNRATILPQETGLQALAHFPAPGEITVAAVIPKEFTGQNEITIPVKVKVIKNDKATGGFFGQSAGNDENSVKEKKEISSSQVEIQYKGQTIKLAIEPGELTVLAGKSIQFQLRALSGSLPPDLMPEWKITDDPNAADIDKNGKAIFKHQGEIIVAAIVPGIAKKEPFYFISNIGKVAKGLELLKPSNWDVLSLILLFGVTMYLSQKFMTTAPPADADQAAIQKQTQQIMPFTVTGMFFFIPLPAGVYLYMVFSNILQTLQTWMVARQTGKIELIDDLDEPGSQTIDVVPTNKANKAQKLIAGAKTSQEQDSNKKQEGKKK